MEAFDPGAHEGGGLKPRSSPADGDRMKRLTHTQLAGILRNWEEHLGPVSAISTEAAVVRLNMANLADHLEAGRLVVL